jgi:TonB family protein
MFGQPSAQVWPRQRRLTSASLALHGMVLAWLLHTPAPQLLTPSSVALGWNGRAVSRLYWPAEAPDNSNTSSASSATESYRHQRLRHEKLIWKQTSKSAKLNAQLPLTRAEMPNPSTADPVAYPWELPGSEGNVVVEITIDERGEIVRKTVLQSLGPKLDEKVMAALEGWHFHPATRNGVAIASKQDAIFHFRARG